MSSTLKDPGKGPYDCEPGQAPYADALGGWICEPGNAPYREVEGPPRDPGDSEAAPLGGELAPGNKPYRAEPAFEVTKSRVFDAEM